jgi:hypothetical protein
MAVTYSTIDQMTPHTGGLPETARVEVSVSGQSSRADLVQVRAGVMALADEEGAVLYKEESGEVAALNVALMAMQQMTVDISNIYQED